MSFMSVDWLFTTAAIVAVWSARVWAVASSLCATCECWSLFSPRVFFCSRFVTHAVATAPSAAMIATMIVGSTVLPFS